MGRVALHCNPLPKGEKQMSTFDRKDVYTRVAEHIISDLEQGHPYMDEAVERRA
jgi:hypothetical protein